MHRSRSPRAQTIRLVIVYTAMTLVVLVTLTILLLFVQGYRYNASERSLEQGGLVQFESRPSGATITFDNQRLPRKTATRFDATSGTHAVTIERDGYRPWQKTITVDPGAVHWLDYVMLIPEKLEPETVYDYDQISHSVSAYEQNKLAVVPDSGQPSLDIIDIGSNQPQRQTIEVPDRLISEEDKRANPKLTLLSWDKTANRILATVTVSDQIHWLIIDTRNPAQSVNISSLFDTKKPVREVIFDKRSSKHVYVLSNKVIYRVAYEDSTKPQPVVVNVESFSQSNRGVIAYTTVFDKKSDSRSVGYYTPDADQPKLIRTYYDDGKPSLRVLIGEYFDSQYLVTQYDSVVEVSRLSLHPSDSDSQLSPYIIATINLEDGIDYLSFSPTERFVIAQHKATYTTYDLELTSVSTTTLRGESPVKTQLSWLDDFHIWSNRDSQLRLYEFDGANVSLIGDVASGQVPALTKNGNYLYYVGPADKDEQQSLFRVRLLP